MTLLLLFNQSVTATVVAVPSATAAASGTGPVIKVSTSPPRAQASGTGSVPGIAVRTSPPRAVTSQAIAIGTVTEPPLLEIKLSIPAPAATASGMAIAPIIQAAGPATITVMPAALATASAAPPTAVGIGGATLLSPPSATASGLAQVPRLSISLLPVSAIGSAISPVAIVAVRMVVPSATASAQASVVFIIVVGVPTGVMIGRLVIIDRITAELEVVG